MVQHAKRYALKMLGDIPDTMLPDGWIGVYHISGAIVYLHRETRVVTWSRPYKISKETSLRSHNIPLISIPCLHQKLAIEKYLEKSDTPNKRTCPVRHNGQPPSKITKTSDENDTELDSTSSAGAQVKCELTNGSEHSHSDEVEDENAGHSSESQKEITECNGNGPSDFDNTNDTDSGIDLKIVAKEHCIKVEDKNDDPSSNDNEDHNNNSKNNDAETSVESTEEAFILLDETCEEAEDIEVKDKEINNVDQLITSESSCSQIPQKRKLESDSNELLENEFNDVCRGNDLLCACRKTGNIDNPNEVTPSSMHEYLSEIFGFEIMSIEKFKGTVFSCKSHNPNCTSKETPAILEKKFNIVGKTPGQILNEYCQWRKTTVPAFTQVDRHSHQDFTVELTIENLKLGMGSGGTLKQARHNAALHTLNILDHTILNEDDPFAHVALFDQIPVDDKAVLPQIEKHSSTGVKLPYETLLHLLFRNFPSEFSEEDIEFVVEELNSVRRKYTMRYKDYGVTGFCENWQPVREVAAQVLIAVMYPLIPNWGCVIRLVEGYIDIAGNPDLPTKKVRLKRSNDSMDTSRRALK